MSVQLITEERKVFSFCGNDIEFIQKDHGQCEIVIHDSNSKNRNLTIRYASEPYVCYLYLKNGRTRAVDLGDEEDWGNIQQCNPDDDCVNWKTAIGWGNDEDGHIEIIKVTRIIDNEEVEIPLEIFKRDLKDMLILHEA